MKKTYLTPETTTLDICMERSVMLTMSGTPASHNNNSDLESNDNGDALVKGQQSTYNIWDTSWDF